MRESIFTTEIVNSFKALDCWAYKIPDFPQSILTGARFNPEKPFDIVAFIQGSGIAIEGKMFKKFEAFGLRHMRPSQIETFDRLIDKRNAKCFVFLNIRQATPRINRLIILDWSQWRHRLRKDSIKKPELMELSYIQGSKKHFDLSHFVRCIGL